MGDGVVADDVAGLDNFADDFRMLPHVVSDQKESGVDAVPREDFQQTQRVRVVGAVIIGEGDLMGGTGESDESFPVPLRRRRHRLVRGCSGGSDGDSGGQDWGEHGGIVFH